MPPGESNAWGFSETAEKWLRRAGWRPHRRRDMAKDLRNLEAKGFEIFPVVRHFLQHFGGLRFTTRKGLLNYRTEFHFDAEDAGHGIGVERVADYAERVGAPLCPIGEAGHATLMMDPTGAIYGGYDEGLVRWGHHPVEAIENLVVGEPVQIIQPEPSCRFSSLLGSNQCVG